MKQIKTAWDPIWDTIFSRQQWGKYPEIFIVRFMANNYYDKDRPNIKVLEVGSGTGKNIWYLAREGFNAYGVDGSQIGIKITKDRLLRNKLKAKVKIGDFIKLDYLTDYFNVVIDDASIQQNDWKDIPEMIQEIHRVLKPGGKFCGRMVHGDTELKENFGKIHFFTKNEIKKLFKNNFKDLKIKPTEYWNDDSLHKDLIVEATKK